VTLTAPAPAATSQIGSAAMLSLSKFEGRRLITHPVVWLGALGSAAMALFEMWEYAPVLNRVSVTLAWTMLPLAASVALVSGWAVLRARGRNDAQPPVVMPLSMDRRVGGIVIGLLWPAALTLLLQLTLLVWVWTRDPVTSIVWTEVLVGPLYVMFAGALGAAMTRWIPHPATPIFSVLVLLGLMVILPYNQVDWGRRIGVEWLQPMAWPQDIIPYEVAFRPAGLHLGYLFGLALALTGIAVAARTWIGPILLGAGLLLALAFGTAQIGLISAGQRVEAIGQLVGDDLECETRDDVKFCAMPGYDGWIDGWQQALTPILQAAPEDASQGIEVRQYPVHNVFLLDGQDYNDWWWIQPSYEDLAGRDVIPVSSMLASWSHIEIFGSLAARIVGCDVQFGCQGESQRIALLWLLLHDPESQSNILETAGSDYAEVSECMVAELWRNPGSTELIVDNWDVLTAPETSYDQAGEILGVSVPTGYDQNGILVGGCP